MGWPFLVWLEIAFDGNSCYIRLLWGEWYSWVALGNSSYNLIHSSQLSHNTRIKNPDSEEKKSWATTLSVRNVTAIPYFQVSPFGKLAVSLSTRAKPESIVFRSGTDLLRINPLCGIRPSLFSETAPISSPSTPFVILFQKLKKTGRKWVDFYPFSTHLLPWLLT